MYSRINCKRINEVKKCYFKIHDTSEYNKKIEMIKKGNGRDRGGTGGGRTHLGARQTLAAWRL